MAKIFVNKNKEPFEVSRQEAEEIKKYWEDETIPRSKKITFGYFTGTLGDIKNFDMRSERVDESTKKVGIEYEPITPELRKFQQEMMTKYRPAWIDEYKNVGK